MPNQPNVYSVRRNDIPAALKFVEENWGQLRPEDFTILRQLQDNPLAYMQQLNALKNKLKPLKGSPLRRELRRGD
jgi:hypothetical protein